MKPDEFFGKYDGKGIDFDGYYGFQCMDLYRQFVKEVLGLPQSPSVTGAVNVWDTFLQDKFERIENTLTAVPVKGDIIIWSQGVGQFGHIAVCKDADINSFTSFDQNWPVGSLCHFQKHNYTNVLGWLRVKPVVNPLPPQEPLKIDLGEPYGLLEVQQIRSMMLAKDQAINSLENVNEDLNDILNQIETIAFGRGWIWVKLNNIKKLLV